MPPKRKHTVQPVDSPPSKRRTRSSTIADTASTPATGSPAVTRTYSGRTRRLTRPSTSESSNFLKENESHVGDASKTVESDDGEEDGDADELNISSKKQSKPIAASSKSHTPIHAEDSRQSEQSESTDLSCIVVSSSKAKFEASVDVLTKSMTPNTTATTSSKVSKAKDKHTTPSPSNSNGESDTGLKHRSSTRQKIAGRSATAVKPNLADADKIPLRLTRRSTLNITTTAASTGSQASTRSSPGSDNESETQGYVSPVTKALFAKQTSITTTASTKRRRLSKETEVDFEALDGALSPSSPMLSIQASAGLITRSLRSQTKHGAIDPKQELQLYSRPSRSKRKSLAQVSFHAPVAETGSPLTSASPSEVYEPPSSEGGLWHSSPTTAAVQPVPRISSSKLPIDAQMSPIRMSTLLPPHLYLCLTAQKQAVLRALQNPPDITVVEGAESEEHLATNDVAAQQLTDLLNGTVTRGEGNSCLVLGPRGSGKNRMIEKCLSNLGRKPIILRLSGWVQHSDRLAMHEIANQLSLQTGGAYLSNIDNTYDASPEEDEGEEVNPFLDAAQDTHIGSASDPRLTPSSHLPALISLLPTLSRPIIVVLDAFDLFASHPRQSLLYCLLDTVQSCRASSGTSGVTVIGVTSRVDTIQLLEKRVKSRFSGRIIRTAAPRKVEDWKDIVVTILSSHCHCGNSELDAEWQALWDTGVERFIADKVVQNVFIDTFSITSDIYTLRRLLTTMVLQLTLTSPYPLASHILSGATTQRSRPRFSFLSKISYPSMCLLIASVHADTTGHPTFTFEMLHECFRDQVRSSTSAPVQVNGGGIGMVRCSRGVLMSAFESLISAKIFVCDASISSTLAKEFMKCRCVVGRDEVKKAVEKEGQINLKKWLNKAQ